tara:strand:- start:773 stop:1255 length:483 start_codon:yes stop_codon:yes gene_type:complete
MNTKDQWENLPNKTGKLNSVKFVEENSIGGSKNKIYNIDIDGLQNIKYYLNQHNQNTKNDITQYQVGDILEYKYDSYKKKIKIYGKVINRNTNQPMYNNFEKKESKEYISPTEFKDNNIFFQSARRDFVLMNQGRNLSLQEIHDGALELYKKHKQIKNQL